MLKLDVPPINEVQHAIERVKEKNFGIFQDRSLKVYVQCPIDKDLWDIKPIGGIIWEDEINPANKRKYTTNRFLPPILEAGFVIVKFTKPEDRKLGIYGCDLSELNAAHTLTYPDGRKVKNEFVSKEKEFLFPDGKRRKVFINPRVRNNKHKEIVISAAGGFCDACSERVFQKPGGAWFLEAHHKTWLSEEGPDIPENMVALCPNCHRQEHYGRNRRYPKRNWV